jgi:hypothetical protein
VFFVIVLVSGTTRKMAIPSGHLVCVSFFFSFIKKDRRSSTTHTQKHPRTVVLQLEVVVALEHVGVVADGLDEDEGHLLVLMMLGLLH